ncbi:MAG: DEAD/DEAH box helicase [Synergistaceae bacterium]|nr:DEAD/DEAH box helicase [Synergistaceae bacterium]
MIKALRDYQVKAIRETYKWLAANDGNPCIVAPTGSGKAYIIAGFCEDILHRSPERKILVLSHVKELLVQDAEKITIAWPEAPVAIYSAGLGSKATNTITVAGIQSIWKKASELGHIDLIIVDEAHTIQNEDSGMYRTLISDLKAINPKLRIIGLTATPYRLGQGLLTEGDEAIFDALIEPVTIQELVKRGYLAKLTSTFTDFQINTDGIKRVQGDFEKRELETRVNSENINAQVVNETIKRAGDRTAWLIFCVSISHAEAMCTEFRAHGVTCEAITSKTSGEERDRIFQDFKAGKIKAVTNVGVATTGFDYPDIDVIVMARPTLSPGLYAQMSGRGMRLKSEGHHKDCIVLDFAGNIARHGPVTKIIPPRRTIAKSTRITTENIGEMFKLCPKCKKAVLKRARTCPNCNYLFSENTLTELNMTQDIMQLDENDSLTQSQEQTQTQSQSQSQSQSENITRMKVHSWYWRAGFTKNEHAPFLRVDFYEQDLMKGPKQLFLYLTSGTEGSRNKAYRNLKSLLQGVRVPLPEELNNIQVMNALAKTISENYTPPSYIEYKQSGKYINIINWGWD